MFAFKQLKRNCRHIKYREDIGRCCKTCICLFVCLFDPVWTSMLWYLDNKPGPEDLSHRKSSTSFQPKSVVIFETKLNGSQRCVSIGNVTQNHFLSERKTHHWLGAVKAMTMEAEQTQTQRNTNKRQDLAKREDKALAQKNQRGTFENTNWIQLMLQTPRRF